MAQLTQLPDEVDLSFVAGDTFRIRVRVIDPSEGDPLPLAEYSFRADVIKDPDRSWVVSFDVEPDVDDPANAVVLSLPSDDTDSLPSQGDGKTFNGLWDLEVTFPNGDVRTVAKGAVNCYLDVTNRPV